MQIYCPKCKTGYEVDADVVPENGRKLRCAICQKVFKCMPEDLTDGSKLRMAEFTEEEKSQLNEDGMLEEKQEVETVASVEEVAEQQEGFATEVGGALAEEEDVSAEVVDAEFVDKSLDELEAEEKGVNEQDVKDIFQRLSAETDALFRAECEEKPVKKIISDFKKDLGLRNPRNYKYYYFVVLFFIVLAAYYARFEIVRSIPSLAPIYNALHIKAKVTGEGLEFQNITRREYEEDAISKFEIKGFIANNTAQTMDIPVIYVEFLDKDARPIQSQKVNSVIPIITPNAKIAFNFIVEKPSSLTKYIYLTFADRK